MEGRCYRHRCTGPNRYQIQVFDSGWVGCPAGGAIQVTARHEWVVLGGGVLRAINIFPSALPPQVEGYHGAIFCPDGRLCLPSVLTPPSENASTSPASMAGQVGLQPNLHVLPTQPDTHTRTGPYPVTAALLCVAAAAGMLAAAATLSRGWISCGVRIHSAPGDPANV